MRDPGGTAEIVETNISGKEYSRAAGAVQPDVIQDIEAINAGHPHIGYDNVWLHFSRDGDRLLWVAHEQTVGLMTECPKHAFEPAQDVGLVVDEQDAAHADGCAGWKGITTVKVVPRPTSLAHVTWPPWASVMACTRARPCPVPLPTGLVVKKGSKM